MPTGAEWAAILLPLTVGTALISLSVFVLRAARNRVYNLFFSALYFLSGIKSYTEGIRPFADEFNAAAPAFPGPNLWASIGFVCALYMLPMLVLFLLLFPRPQPLITRFPVLGFLLFTPSVVFTYLFLLEPWGVRVYELGLTFNALAVVATVAALVVILHTRHTTVDHIERARAGYILVGFLPAFAGTWVLAGLDWYNYLREVPLTATLGAQVTPHTVLVNYVTPLLELAAAAVTGYAIVKYQLLGIELKVRIGAKYALTTTFIVSVVFLVKEGVGELVLEPVFGFSDLYWVLSGVVGVVLFKPLESGANWATNKMFPDATRPKHEYRDKRATEIYHAQATYVLRDANVTERELRFLHNLRAQLGLSEEEAHRIEERVERMLRLDSPHTGHSARRAVRNG